MKRYQMLLITAIIVLVAIGLGAWVIYRVISRSPDSLPNTVQCEVSSCHGMNFSCGIPPQACDASYQLGDRCLQYAQCSVQDNRCQKVETDAFKACKSCAEACQAANPNDPVKLFQCESECK